MNYLETYIECLMYFKLIVLIIHTCRRLFYENDSYANNLSSLDCRLCSLRQIHQKMPRFCCDVGVLKEKKKKVCS